MLPSATIARLQKYRQSMKKSLEDSVIISMAAVPVARTFETLTTSMAAVCQYDAVESLAQLAGASDLATAAKVSFQTCVCLWVKQTLEDCLSESELLGATHVAKQDLQVAKQKASIAKVATCNKTVIVAPLFFEHIWQKSRDVLHNVTSVSVAMQAIIN